MECVPETQHAPPKFFEVQLKKTLDVMFALDTAMAIAPPFAYRNELVSVL